MNTQYFFQNSAGYATPQWQIGLNQQKAFCADIRFIALHYDGAKNCFDIYFYLNKVLLNLFVDLVAGYWGKF